MTEPKKEADEKLHKEHKDAKQEANPVASEPKPEDAPAKSEAKDSTTHAMSASDPAAAEFLYRIAKKKEAVKERPVLNEKSGINQVKEPTEFLSPIKVHGSITLVSREGRGSVNIQANEEVSGIWIQTEALKDKFPKSSIAIYDDPNGPVIGFYRDTGEKALVLSFAIGLDDNGMPTIQVDNGRGNVGVIGVAELLDKVKPDWR